MAITYHARDRIEERLEQAGWSAPDRDKLLTFCDSYGERTHVDSEAVRVAVLPTLVGEYGGDQSNGNEVWAIYRAKALVTMMLRRSEQPDWRMRCRKVTRLV